jgi:ArsR family transcriptional regulator
LTNVNGLTQWIHRTRPEETFVAVTELPLLDQVVAEQCCTPLVLEPLPEVDAAVLSERFAALGDPVRLRLVSLLANAEGGAVCVCDLTAPVERSQGTVSHHLKVLSKAGLVVSEKRGRNMWYSVVPSALESLRAALATR